MHLLIKVKSPNNISKWQMGFNSAFKELILFKKILKFVTTIVINMLSGQNGNFVILTRQAK
jgi:hypothetical protein